MKTLAFLLLALVPNLSHATTIRTAWNSVKCLAENDGYGYVHFQLAIGDATVVSGKKFVGDGADIVMNQLKLHCESVLNEAYEKSQKVIVNTQGALDGDVVTLENPASACTISH